MGNSNTQRPPKKTEPTGATNSGHGQKPVHKTPGNPCRDKVQK